MKELLIVLVLALCIGLIGWVLPAWWWLMVIPMIFGIVFKGSVHKKAGLSFLAGFIAWTISTLFQYVRHSELISAKIAELGSSIHSLVKRTEKKYNYY